MGRKSVNPDPCTPRFNQGRSGIDDGRWRHRVSHGGDHSVRERTLRFARDPAGIKTPTHSAGGR